MTRMSGSFKYIEKQIDHSVWIAVIPTLFSNDVELFLSNF